MPETAAGHADALVGSHDAIKAIERQKNRSETDTDLFPALKACLRLKAVFALEVIAAR
jgi:hypothetical protein